MENKEIYLECDGLKVHGKLQFPEEEKSKYPILIVFPGLTGHIEEEHIIVAAQTANEMGMAALRVELYGHGKSEGAFFDHNVLIWMHQAIRVIDQVRKMDFVEEIFVSGHSQGGLTAILAAGVMHDVVNGLIPMSPATNIYYGCLEGQMLQNVFDPDHLPESLNLYDDFNVSGTYIRAARTLPLTQCIAQYRKPVAVIHGTSDETVPYDCGVELVSQYSDAQLISIADADHGYNGKLELFKTAVKESLKSIMCREKCEK